MKTHMQRYRLIDVGPHKVNKIVEVPEQGDSTYGLQEWLTENLGHRVGVYYLEGSSVLNRTQLVIQTLWGTQQVLGHATILGNDDAVIYDLASYREMFDRRRREEALCDRGQLPTGA